MNSFKGVVPVNSFKGYGKVDEGEERDYRRKTRKRMLIVVISVIVLAVIVVAAAVGVSKSKSKNKSDNPQSNPSSSSIKSVCAFTRYPDSCFSSLTAVNNASVTDPEDVFKLSLQVAIEELTKISALPEKIAGGINDKRVVYALNDCKELFDDAIDRLNSSLSLMIVGAGEKLLTDQKMEDMKAWLSTAITDQETCVDGFENTTGVVRDEVQSAMKNATEFVSNSLAIVNVITKVMKLLDIPIHRKLLSAGEFPAWFTSKDRKLLQVSNPEPNLIVAKDGSGNFTNISDAINQVPKKSDERFVIYVKRGTYVENVLMDKKIWNVMMYGDGKDATIVSGGLNFIDGTPTFRTATFAVTGKGFMARDIGFRNTAGPEKHQAVAFRSGSDQSVFYRCDFDAYQDTLYAHSNRQFYRECTISGTVDFIFGNAAVVFQNCAITARKPLDNQKNTVTAQGKSDPGQNTGISIQGCQIVEAANLTAPTYLGRPWKAYSTTVIMKSTIGGGIDPAGWLTWTGNPAEVPPNTIYYAEYMNEGPGSSVAKRITWEGYKPSISSADAGKFAVNSFIQGNEWLSETGVTYEATL